MHLRQARIGELYARRCSNQGVMEPCRTCDGPVMLGVFDSAGHRSRHACCLYSSQSRSRRSSPTTGASFGRWRTTPGGGGIPVPPQRKHKARTGVLMVGPARTSMRRPAPPQAAQVPLTASSRRNLGSMARVSASTFSCQAKRHTSNAATAIEPPTMAKAWSTDHSSPLPASKQFCGAARHDKVWHLIRLASRPARTNRSGRSAG